MTPSPRAKPPTSAGGAVVTLLTALVLLVSLSSCTTDSSAGEGLDSSPSDIAGATTTSSNSMDSTGPSFESESPVDPEAPWRRVELPAADSRSFAWVDGRGVVIEYDLGNTTNALMVEWGGTVVPIPPPEGNPPVIGRFPGDAGPVAVAAGDDGSLVFHHYDYTSEFFHKGEFAPPGPDLEPLAVWWGTEDEGSVIVAAYRHPDGTIGLYPEDWEFGRFDPTPSLFVDSKHLDDLLVGASEGQIVVVGPVGPEPAQLPDEYLAWRTHTIPEVTREGERLPRMWTPIVPDPQPDTVTDIDNWVLDVFLAGRVGNRPTIWNVGVDQVDLPELELGGDRTVLVAAAWWPGEDNPAIAIETTEGPMLLVPRDGRWDQVELPKGRLEDVVAIQDARPFDETVDDPYEPGDGLIYVIIDGVVWSRSY